MLDAARAKARRGELRISVPIGYIRYRDAGLGFEPDLRVQEAVGSSAGFESGEAVARYCCRGRQTSFASTSDGRTQHDDFRLDTHPISQCHLGAKESVCAGVYAYGKSEKRTEIIYVRARKTYGHGKPKEEWDFFLKGSPRRVYRMGRMGTRPGAARGQRLWAKGRCKSGRGGPALLSGLISCGRCGRRRCVAYTGKTQRPIYRCERPNLMLGLNRCRGYGGPRIDEAVPAELLRVVQPMAIEAAMQSEAGAERRRAAELDLQKAQYEAALPEGRYAAYNPDNRLIAATLEKNGEVALKRRRQDTPGCRRSPGYTGKDAGLDGLAEDLQAAWNAPGVSTRARQRLARALIKDIVADVDEEAREVAPTIHWPGG